MRLARGLLFPNELAYPSVFYSVCVLTLEDLENGQRTITANGSADQGIAERRRSGMSSRAYPEEGQRGCATIRGP